METIVGYKLPSGAFVPAVPKDDASKTKAAAAGGAGPPKNPPDPAKSATGSSWAAVGRGLAATRPPPDPSNYRGRYNAARAALGETRLPADWDAHHRIPQEYRDHSEFKDFDFDAPSNTQGVEGSRANSGENVHQKITNDWAAFRVQNPQANRAQIEAFARTIDVKYNPRWWK